MHLAGTALLCIFCDELQAAFGGNTLISNQMVVADQMFQTEDCCVEIFRTAGTAAIRSEHEGSYASFKEISCGFQDTASQV